jgi:hypothetical protein
VQVEEGVDGHSSAAIAGLVVSIGESAPQAAWACLSILIAFRA